MIKEKDTEELQMKQKEGLFAGVVSHMVQREA